MDSESTLQEYEIQLEQVIDQLQVNLNNKFINNILRLKSL